MTFGPITKDRNKNENKTKKSKKQHGKEMGKEAKTKFSKVFCWIRWIQFEIKHYSMEW